MKIAGETLRLWRTMKRLNQHGIAESLNISQQEYSKWECREYVNGEQLQRFLKICGCTIEELENLQKLCPPRKIRRKVVQEVVVENGEGNPLFNPSPNGSKPVRHSN